MAFVEINPRYRDVMARLGILGPAHFLDLPGVIVSGHPDRHVVRVTLGDGPGAVRAFLKREHRVPWLDRLANARDGFGFVSKSCREATTLRDVWRAGVGCPEWIASGEAQGRAFLLVREAGGVDLRQFLRDGLPPAAPERRRFARRLAKALARMHAAGFDHPDLYSKHVLVNPRTGAFCFLDWQRSGRRRYVGWDRRRRDLAALNATLSDDLVTGSERLFCLWAYLAADTGRAAASRRARAFDIHSASRRLAGKRHVREVRDGARPAVAPEVIWLDGEALCVTPDFWAELRGRVPEWLRLDRLTTDANPTTCVVVPLADGRNGILTSRRRRQPWRWLWSFLGRGRPTSPEVLGAGALFRLRREGLDGPQVLAFGQRRRGLCRTESFLLTELPAAAGGPG